MSSSSNLIRPEEDYCDGHAKVGRFEHGNKFHVLAMDDEVASEGGSSLEEPLFDEGQEISDEDEMDEQDIEEAAGQAAVREAEEENAGEEGTNVARSEATSYKCDTSARISAAQH